MAHKPDSTSQRGGFPIRPASTDESVATGAGPAITRHYETPRLVADAAACLGRFSEERGGLGAGAVSQLMVTFQFRSCGMAV